MAYINFSCPTDPAELLSEMGDHYTVQNVVIIPEIHIKLQEARVCLKDEGAEFILTNFDTYYSVLHHGDKIHIDVTLKAFNDLQRAVVELNNSLGYVLEDKDNLTEEVQEKMLGIVRMLLYIFIQFVKYFEQLERKEQMAFGKKKKGDDKEFNGIDKPKVIITVGNIMQRPLNLLWDPPVVAHEFVEMIAEIGHLFLQNANIKTNKNFAQEIFGFFGNLIVGYDYGKTFVTRTVQYIRMYEHYVQIVPSGIKLLVEQFNCKKYIHHFAIEATEWQTDETYPDERGAKHCATFLTELASLLPDLLLPEVMYLDQYLGHDSIPLRISILNVVTEMIATVLNKHEMCETDKLSRDIFLEMLMEHCRDVAGAVRSKVFHNLGRLQKEAAIPLKKQLEVLNAIVEHLQDKGAQVRKAALNCLTMFLEHNPFAADLQLERTEQELERKKQMLEEMEQCYKEAQKVKIEEITKQWEGIEEELRAQVKEHLTKGIDEEDDDEEEENAEEGNEEETAEKEGAKIENQDALVDKIGALLMAKQYKEALKTTYKLRNTIDEWKTKKNMNMDTKVELYMALLRAFYFNPAKINEALRISSGMTEDDIKKLNTLEDAINYSEKTLAFLNKVDSAMNVIKKMLFSQTIGDMHEAINFFIAAYKFNMANVESGVFAMLKLMQYNEQDRKNAVVAACKTIYLTTDSTNMRDHTTTIVDRLIPLVMKMPYENIADFQNIVAEWTSKGILDNNVIAKLWEYFTKRLPITDEQSRVSCELLRMAALGRQTIITKNIPMVASVAFGERGRKDLQFFESACRLLCVIGKERVNIQSEKTPFKISPEDVLFDNMIDILVEHFDKDVPFYGAALQAGVKLIFRTCSTPFVVYEKLMHGIQKKTDEEKNSTVVLIRFCDLLGVSAVEMAEFMDNTTFRELKRRNYVREALKENRNKPKKKKANRRRNTMNQTLNATILNNVNDESIISTATNSSLNSTNALQSGEATDTDAEYILNLLENVVLTENGGGFLSHYMNFLKSIVEKREQYNIPQLQLSATRAFMRFMLISSRCCSTNIRLLFTVFETTPYPEVKRSILMHLSDLLTRFPNIIEPWSPRIFKCLQDPLLEIRKVAFYCLANLIFRDMIRAHGHVSEMAVCLVDEDKEINDLAKTFFTRMSHKDNNLINSIPDIFAHLVQNENVEDEKLRFILKFLFDQIDKSKKMENLVDRMCSKYTVNEDPRTNRIVTYCLSLIEYNDRSLKKLLESFPKYKHHVHDQEVYTLFAQILAEAKRNKPGKPDLKPVAAEIEKCIASVFELNEDGQAMPPPPIPKVPKAKKVQRGRKKTKKPASDEEDDLDFEDATPKKTTRRNSGRGRNKKAKVDSDSD